MATAVLAQFAFALIAFLIFRIVFFDHFEGFATPTKSLVLEDAAGEQFERILEGPLRAIGYGVALPWAWVLAYLRLADTEVK